MSRVVRVAGDGWELYRGTYTQGLRQLHQRGQRVHLLASDPPFSAKTHDGHRAGTKSYDGAERRDIDYDAWTPRQMVRFVRHVAPHVIGWMAIMTDTELGPWARRQMELEKRYTFPPLPAIIPGMTVRTSGDGPSSEHVSVIVSRPRNLAYARWGTTRGYYLTPGAAAGLPREACTVVGGKPLELCRQIVRDYSRRGELVLDTCAGGGNMLLAAVLEGRHAIGFEPNPGRFEMAVALLEKPRTRTLELPDLEVKPAAAAQMEYDFGDVADAYCSGCGGAGTIGGRVASSLAELAPVPCPTCGGGAP
jgi:hypothetical protein